MSVREALTVSRENKRSPGPPADSIARPRLVAHLSGDERVVLIVAPPGYGKTELARQWAEVTPGAAWLAVDLLDDAPAVFWSDFLRALRGVISGIDDEPGLLLTERGPADLVFLDALIAQLERAGERAALVIDDVWRVTDRSVYDGLSLLVARVGHLIRFVIVSRSDPPLPTAQWRSRRWVTEVREERLRFSDDEAMTIAAGLDELAVSENAVVALNTRAEGWPIALHLALVSLSSEPEPDSKAHAMASADRLLFDYLVSEVVDRLPDDQRDVALALSVLNWFDAGLCADLLGESAVPAADELRRRRLFLTTIDGATGAVRFHRLFRELLENELRWRDPTRRIALHRRAAEMWKARGDLASAYGHLVAIADDSAADVILELALDLVNHGDVSALAGHMRSLPRSLKVRTASQAFDLSLAWFLAGEHDEAIRWCAVGEDLSDPMDSTDRARAHCAWAVIKLMQGAISGASAHVADFERLVTETKPDLFVDERFAPVGAYAALLARRFDEARSWIERAQTIVEPATTARVTVPSLAAWLELEVGDLRHARSLADGACRNAERFGLRPHHGAFEALAVAAQCRLAMGEPHQAEELLELARSDAAVLGWPLPRVRAGLLAVEVVLLRSGPRSALAAIEELRDDVELSEWDELDRWVAATEVAVLIGCGSYRTAQARVERLADAPRTLLLKARLALASRSGQPIEVLLEHRSNWSVAERLEAEVLLAVAHVPRNGDERLAAVVAMGHETGWVSPFLGLGNHVDSRLVRLPLVTLHPALAMTLRPERKTASSRFKELVEPLSPREMTLLELLPTHYSYAQIGDRLFLSVNTIKSNLKSIYRKLDVTSRADAVDAAFDLGLLTRVSSESSPSAARIPDH
jgi:LuxR family maltose regulon positive regulatory protein